MKIRSFFAIKTILFSVLYLSADALASVYVGVEAGKSIPLQGSFKDPTSKSIIKVDRSKMGTVRLGYRYYPGFAIELEGTRKPKYPVNMTLQNGLSGDTKIKSDSLAINLLYDVMPMSWVQPYVTMGLGVARVTVEASQFGIPRVLSFNINHTKSYHPVVQMGVGAMVRLFGPLQLDISAKIHAIGSVKAKYRAISGLGTTTGAVKKSIGVGELGVGLTLDLW